MKKHYSELISALVDGELKGLRRWLTQRHVNRCAECATKLQQLRQVREMLAANPTTPPMSDSLEFFWSKVRHEIQARGGQAADVPMPAPSLSDWLGQHRYAFATAATLVVAVEFAQSAPGVASGAPGSRVVRMRSALHHGKRIGCHVRARRLTKRRTQPGVSRVQRDLAGCGWAIDDMAATNPGHTPRDLDRTQDVVRYCDAILDQAAIGQYERRRTSA